MTKMSLTAAARASALALGVPLSGAFAEQNLDPREAYNKALNDCAQFDNPDRWQQCRDKAEERFEQAQKARHEDGGMEKQKQKQTQY